MWLWRDVWRSAASQSLSHCEINNSRVLLIITFSACSRLSRRCRSFFLCAPVSHFCQKTTNTRLSVRPCSAPLQYSTEKPIKMYCTLNNNSPSYVKTLKFVIVLESKAASAWFLFLGEKKWKIRSRNFSELQSQFHRWVWGRQPRQTVAATFLGEENET